MAEYKAGQAGGSQPDGDAASDGEAAAADGGDE